ncbi:flavin reductase family protein [Conexibacter sp. DBS9H8]|uniref:flavin reductase family protein n=1 Tax=Conexibacter sp. DBS9H8 TaxID=2937801 RepID=UPI00200D0D57|nr:2Fe-2S iron-sulfur cluster-binding protein [Conexibacter sp. DBS9H8]
MRSTLVGDSAEAAGGLSAPRRGAVRRLLAGPIVDLMVGPHGIDRYLELISPTLTLHEPRAQVLAVTRQTARTVTLTVDPNRAFTGFRAGQFVRVGVEIDGRRYTRTYSPTISEHDLRSWRRPPVWPRRPEDHPPLLEFTVTVREGGVVGAYLREHAAPGMLLHLSDAAGAFILPECRPDHVALISGGSGITPTIAMLRTLIAEGHRGQIDFLHYGRGAADWLYRPQVEAIAAAHPNVDARFIATREGGERFCAGTVAADAHVLVCGPPSLIDAVRAAHPEASAETFTPPTLALGAGAGAATGTVSFLASGHSAPISPGTLLEQAEAAGLTPQYGCRMGICHGCSCTKVAGTVQNILTGELSTEEDQEIQICISVPVSDVALAL